MESRWNEEHEVWLLGGIEGQLRWGVVPKVRPVSMWLQVYRCGGGESPLLHDRVSD